MTAIATGGLSKKIVPYCKREVILDDDLLLKGLLIIYRKTDNRKVSRDEDFKVFAPFIKRMNTYRITVAYDGTAYRGWQRQENTELTVQGILERRISEIAGKKTVVSGSGRTDSGVHALGQECSLYLEQEIDMDSFKKQLNALLPEDIRVLDISRENGLKKKECGREML